LIGSRGGQKGWKICGCVERWRVLRRSAAAILLFAASVHAVEIRVASFNIGAHWNEEFFDYSLGDPGTPDHDTVRDILRRIDADVVALQEIHSVDLQGNPNDLQALATSLGYPHLHEPPFSGVFDTSLKVVFLSRHPFLSTANIGSAPGANEITRYHPVVKVDVPGTANDPVIISAHLKAGTTTEDRFRRAIEMKRLTGYLTTASPGADDNFIILGDFNPSSSNTTVSLETYNGFFTKENRVIPLSYSVGGDVLFPVTYSTNMLSYFTTPSAVKLDPRQLNGSASTYDTTSPGGPVLDLILVSPAIAGRTQATEIYNSALDTSNSSGLPKAGAPLDAGTSATASDHYAVFADLELHADFPGPYGFQIPGETVVENFAGFTGLHDPAPWLTTGGQPWLGSDDGSSALSGWRVYGSGPGFLTDGGLASISAVIENRSPTPLTALDVALDASQWRAVMNGAADRMHVDVVTDAGTIPLPGLTFTASQALPSGPVPGGAAIRLSAMATGLWIPPGGSFGLRVSFVPGDGTGPPPSDVFINEFHYDNTGADTGEFMEIVVGPGFGGMLSDIDILLYNGSTSSSATVYRTLNLAQDFTPGATSSGYRFFSVMLPPDSIQNGGNDGFAVVNMATSQVLHLISYEGVFTAAGGPAAGMTSTSIGVSQNGTEAPGEAALGLTASGAAAGDFTWTKLSGIAHSPGQPNSGQIFVTPTLPRQGLGFDNLAVTFLTDNDLDGLPDIADPDDDNDGQSDDDEIAFGSGPLNPASRFAPVIARTASGLELSFPGAPGIAYTIEFSETLGDWHDLTTVTGEGGPIVVPLPMAEPAMFFRVRAAVPGS
jgi:endonuclease/exonuclease/phosphatase family metal-dependent hydrolase